MSGAVRPPPPKDGPPLRRPVCAFGLNAGEDVKLCLFGHPKMNLLHQRSLLLAQHRLPAPSHSSSAPWSAPRYGARFRPSRDNERAAPRPLAPETWSGFDPEEARRHNIALPIPGGKRTPQREEEQYMIWLSSLVHGPVLTEAPGSKPPPVLLPSALGPPYAWRPPKHWSSSICPAPFELLPRRRAPPRGTYPPSAPTHNV
jgi:hypothetical protein